MSFFHEIKCIRSTSFVEFMMCAIGKMPRNMLKLMRKEWIMDIHMDGKYIIAIALNCAGIASNCAAIASNCAAIASNCAAIDV